MPILEYIILKIWLGVRYRNFTFKSSRISQRLMCCLGDIRFEQNGSFTVCRMRDAHMCIWRHCYQRKDYNYNNTNLPFFLLTLIWVYTFIVLRKNSIQSFIFPYYLWFIISKLSIACQKPERLMTAIGSLFIVAKIVVFVAATAAKSLR